MNLDKAREAYANDPQYHQLVELLMQQVKMLKLTPSEVREVGVFACILLAERRVHPLMMINFAEVEKHCMSTEQYKHYVLGEFTAVEKGEEPDGK